MKNFILRQFDSRNTAFDRTIVKRNGVSAKNWAKQISLKTKWPVMIMDEKQQGWIKYENGERTEWSTAWFQLS